MATRGHVRPALVASLTASLDCATLDTSGALMASDGVSLLLARGPLGGESLYYAWLSDGQVLFASTELAAVVRQLASRPRVSEPRLASFAAGLFAEDRTGTHYEGVARLDAGESLYVGPHGVERRRSLPEAISEVWLEGDVRELAIELRRRIDVAVGRATEGAKRVAVLVGGIDSSSVVASLVAQSRGATPKELDVLTCDLGGPGCDSAYVDALCDAYGLVPLHIAAHATRNAAPLSLVMDDAPATLELYEHAAIEHARARGADVALSGHFGDDVFGGDLGLLGSALATQQPLKAIRAAAFTRFPLPQSRASLVLQLVARPFARRLFSPLLRRASQFESLRAQLPWARPRMLALCERALRANAEVRAADPDGPGAYFRSYADSQAFVDSADASARVESVTHLACRCPFADVDLVRFVTAIRPDLLHTGGIYRGLLRLAMRDAMPEHVRMRVDKADPRANIVSAFIDHPSAVPLRSVRELAARDLVDPVAFSSAVTGADRARSAGALLEVLAAEAFLRHTQEAS